MGPFPTACTARIPILGGAVGWIQGLGFRVSGFGVSGFGVSGVRLV